MLDRINKTLSRTVGFSQGASAALVRKVLGDERVDEMKGAWDAGIKAHDALTDSKKD